MLAAGEGAPAAAPSGGPGAVAACATGAAELIAWKSHLGVSISADKRLLRSSAKGWGRSGALSEPLLTRQGAVEGFVTTLPQASPTLFIGISNLSGSLRDKGRAHQEDMEHGLRVSSDGLLSYHSQRSAASTPPHHRATRRRPAAAI